MRPLVQGVLVMLMAVCVFRPADEASAQAAKRGTRLITLGTLAGPIPRAHRAQSSNLLIVNGTHYVIDAGDGVVRRLAKARINIRDIGTIFITHHHDDHTAGLGTLMSVAWEENRTQPINVYGPPGTEALVKAAVQYFSMNSEIRIADGGRSIPIAKVFAGHDVVPGVVFQDSNIKVTAIENTHFEFHKGAAAGKFKSYSYRFDTPDRVIVFAGDTGWSDALVELARNADVLIAEGNSIEERKQAMMKDGRWQAMSEKERDGILQQASHGHMQPETVGRLADLAKVKAVILTHLSYRQPPNTDNYSPFIDQVKKNFSGTVVVAKDLMEF
ncbi:MAG TPA: MBL fold metallo-hydrolase [Pseudolabrys sp.]|nr:MBL fold metallo-hydrolase [Pseudolabrys sp.]